MKLNLIDRAGNVLLGIMVAVVVTALVAGGLTYSWQKKQGDNKVTEVFKQAEEAKNKASELEQKLNEEQKKLEELVKVDENAPQEWVNYSSTNYNLSFFHPKGWVITDNISDNTEDFSGIGLSLSPMAGAHTWLISVYASSETTVDKLTEEIIKNANLIEGFKTEKEKINVAGVTGTKVTTTNYTTPDLSTETILFSKNSKIYKIIGSGPVADSNFSTFYQSIIIK